MQPTPSERTDMSRHLPVALAPVVSALQPSSFDRLTPLQTALLSEDQLMERMERVTVCFL